MFDVGLSELMIIAVVALVVIGPERLPKVARTAGLLLGRLQRYVSDVKADINREIQLDELKTMQQEITDQVGSLKSSVTHEMREVETAVDGFVDPLERVRAMAAGTTLDTPTAQPGAVAETAVSPAPTSDVTPAVEAQAAPTLAPTPVAAETFKS